MEIGTRDVTSFPKQHKFNAHTLISLSVDRLAGGGGSDGKLVWEEEQRTVLGNMEFSYFHRKHPWHHCPIHMGSTRTAMVCALVHTITVTYYYYQARSILYMNVIIWQV